MSRKEGDGTSAGKEGISSSAVVSLVFYFLSRTCLPGSSSTKIPGTGPSRPVPASVAHPPPGKETLGRRPASPSHRGGTYCGRTAVSAGKGRRELGPTSEN